MQPKNNPITQTPAKPIIDVAPPVATPAQMPSMSVQPVAVRRAPDDPVSPPVTGTAKPDPERFSASKPEPSTEPSLAKPSTPKTDAPVGLIFMVVIVVLGLSAAAVAVYLSS